MPYTKERFWESVTWVDGHLVRDSYINNPPNVTTESLETKQIFSTRMSRWAYCAFVKPTQKSLFRKCDLYLCVYWEHYEEEGSHDGETRP